MPLWNIYHTASCFQTQEEKDAAAKDITDYYCGKGGFPPFYVIVNFIELPSGSMYRGYDRVDSLAIPFVRLAITHIHVHSDDFPIEKAAAYARICDGIDKAIRRSIIDKGYLFEYGVSEEPRELWKVDGFYPPPWKSEAEKLWVKEGKAVPYEHLLESKL